MTKEYSGSNNNGAILSCNKLTISFLKVSESYFQNVLQWMSSSKCLQNKLEYKRRMKNIQNANIKWHTRMFKNVYLQQFAIISVCGMRSVCCLTMFYLPIWWTWWCGSQANVPCMYQYSNTFWKLFSCQHAQLMDMHVY